jgi:DNA helicase HerA-like ATPase
MTFEAIQRYRRKMGKVLPTVITLEEAHNFIKKYTESDEVSATEICSQTFEKIAREGRKFGLSMMISSNDLQSYQPQFYLNVIHFYCIELLTIEIRT